MAVLGNAIMLGGGNSYEEYLGEITGFGTLENTSWADIKAAAMMGTGADYWAVGDTKEIFINGTFGGITVTQNLKVFILGFNNNETYEGKGIHFSVGKSLDGVNVVFVDDNYNATATDTFIMNLTTSTGGWENSYMRNTVCSAFFAALPEELQAVISECPKYTDNVGDGVDQGFYVTATMDKIFLPSEFEVTASPTYGNSGEQHYQTQYDFYKAGNSKIKYNYRYSDTAVAYWTRSPKRETAKQFCYIKTSGASAAKAPNTSLGFSPCFKVG